MKKSNGSEVEFELRKLAIEYFSLFSHHLWPSEHTRWVELIFALTTRTTDKSESQVREIIEKLDDLELLNVEELSQIPEVKDGIDLDAPYAKRIVDFLSESGFTEEESKSSILAMHEAAKSLKKHYDGKIQKYLREYGQRIIDELPQNFSFSQMKNEDRKYAFTYWLQNVLNMPISLRTKGVEKFCRKLRITNAELTREADNLGINLALLDDIIDQYTRDSKKTE